MVYAPAIKRQEIGNHDGVRTWMEYGRKQARDAVGWANFCRTDDTQIEKGELVMSALLMVRLLAAQFNASCPGVHQQLVQHPC
jgi:hypothetical protein